MARETPQTVAARALAQARRRNAPFILQKALIEAGIVESGLQHQKYGRVGSGDRDSVGFLQQRPSAGWGPPGQSIEQDTNQFVDHGLALLRKGFKGSSGQLAQAIQVSAFPARYDQQSRRAQQLVRQSGASVPSLGGNTDPGAGSPTAGAQPNLGTAQTLVPLLKALQGRPQPRASAGVAAPAFSAAPAMPAGYQPALSGGGPAPKQDVNALLAAVQTIGGAAPQTQAQPVGMATPEGMAAAAGKVISGGGYPTGRRGKLIGFPHTGTHTLGNWQSDNAVDIAVPIGTPMVAAASGVVTKVRRHPQGAGRFAGDQITIQTPDGQGFFYAHGVAHVKPGQKVKAGQVLGTTGSANGVQHLHFGVERGDPRKLIGQGR